MKIETKGLRWRARQLGGGGGPVPDNFNTVGWYSLQTRIISGLLIRDFYSRIIKEVCVCVQGDKQKSRRPTLYSVAAAIRTGIFIGERQHFGVILLQEE